MASLIKSRLNEIFWPVILFIGSNLIILSHGLHSNETRANSSSVHGAPSIISLSANSSSSYYFHHPYPANHRVEPTGSLSVPLKSNNSIREEHHDRLASDSILRPQLALQIFTQPSQPTSSPDGAGPFSLTKSSAGNTMLVLSKQPEVSGLSGQHQTRGSDNRRSLQSSVGEIVYNKLNPWHYVTEQSASGNRLDGITALSADQGDDNLTTGSSSSSGPLINAIITVPGGNNQEQPVQRTTGGGDLLEADMLRNNSLGSNNVEQALSTYIDNEEGGNIEFSMNVNGDEIIINPVHKARYPSSRNTSRPLVEATSIQAATRGGEQVNWRIGREIRDGNRKILSRALKKHISSELAGDQQSASEIDSVDGSGDESDIQPEDEYDRSSTDRDEERSSKPKLKDIENEIEKDERARPRKHWLDNLTSDSSSYEDEVSRSNPSDNNESKSASDNQNEYNSADQSKRLSGGRQSRPKSSRVRQRKGQPASTSSYATSRRTSSSKRRSTFKTDDQGHTSNADSHHDRKDSGLTSVTIKGEDVRRFEQLLESLKSLQLNNIIAPRLKINRPTPKTTSSASHKSSTIDNSADNNEDNTDDGNSSKSNADEGQPPSRYEKAETNNKGHHSSRGKSSLSEPTNDCDRRQKSSTPRKSSSGVVEDLSENFDTDSSSNVADQEPMSNVDVLEDLVDDGDQSEQEEQSTDNHNRISLPDPEETTVESTSSSPVPVESQKKPPKALFVRKAILQSYYDGLKDQQRESQRADDLESVHRAQHELQHQRDLASVSESQARDDVPKDYSKVRAQEPNTLPLDQDLAPVNNYIDYSQLDNREIFRGPSLMKYKPATPSRDQVDRMRTLQHIMERAAMASR